MNQETENQKVMLMINSEGILRGAGSPEFPTDEEICSFVRKGGTIKTISIEEYRAKNYIVYKPVPIATPDVSEQATNTESDEKFAESFTHTYDDPNNEIAKEWKDGYNDGHYDGVLAGCKHKAQQLQATNNNVDGLENKAALDYWECRCMLAEACLSESPCDLDITKEQIEAHARYNDFLKQHHLPE